MCVVVGGRGGLHKKTSPLFEISGCALDQYILRKTIKITWRPLVDIFTWYNISQVKYHNNVIKSLVCYLKCDFNLIDTI